MNRNRTKWWLLHLAGLSLAASAWGQSQEVSKPNTGRLIDWTSSHILVSGGLSEKSLKLAEVDPRIRFSLEKRFGSHNNQIPQSNLEVATQEHEASRLEAAQPNGISLLPEKIDWSVALGNGNVAAYQTPPKFQFNQYAPPDCVNDYVVFPLNVAGVTNGQANMLAVNNLYSGSSGNPPCGSTPTVNWAYNGSTAKGKVLTSAVLSLDGTKVAYIESATSSAVFHVLTWKAGDGSVTTAAAPVLEGTGKCTASTSCLTSLTFSNTSTDSLVPPWVSYSTDKVFMASDDGTIYRLSCAFNCPNSNPTPTIDWSFQLPVAGTGGSVAQPTEVLYNENDGYLFVADELGEVWTISAGGSTPSVAFGPVMVGGGGCGYLNPPGRTGGNITNPCAANGNSYGVVGNVMLDAGTGMIYASSGNDGTEGGPSAVVVQMPETLLTQVRVHVGLGSVGNTSSNVDLHYGQFDNTYWSNSPSAGYLVLCGTSATSTAPWQYWIGFSAYPVMDSQTKGNQSLGIGTQGIPCTDSSEFYNPNIDLGNSSDHDLLAFGFIGPQGIGQITGDDISFLTFPNNPQSIGGAQYAGGISDIVMDNDGSQPQESSLYFTSLGVVTSGTCNKSRCAIKLTQQGLQ